MTQKRLEIRPGQTSLPIDPPAIYGPEGSYVDLAERAEPLIIALDAVSERNKRLGFEVASNAKHYNRPIRERYRGALPAVQLGAIDNAEELESITKRHLWRAAGYTALRTVKPRLISNKEIDVRGIKMWRDFDATIGHSSHLGDRRALRRQLVKTLVRLEKDSIEAAA